MGWLSKEAKVVEHTVMRLGEEEIEQIARRVAAILLKDAKATTTVLLQAALDHLDPEARAAREG